MEIICLGGTVNRVPPASTAYVHRTGNFLTSFRATWSENDPPELVTAKLAWLQELFASAQPYALPESYQNLTDPTLSNWQQAYYGANFSRLVEVKKKYDPDNFFQFPQSIPTSV